MPSAESPSASGPASAPSQAPPHTGAVTGVLEMLTFLRDPTYARQLRGYGPGIVRICEALVNDLASAAQPLPLAHAMRPFAFQVIAEKVLTLSPTGRVGLDDDFEIWTRGLFPAGRLPRQPEGVVPQGRGQPPVPASQAGRATPPGCRRADHRPGAGSRCPNGAAAPRGDRHTP
jgi:hypothetical protein